VTTTSGATDPLGPAGQVGPAGPVVVLVGPPGAGKTTVGQLVAARLGLPFADTDRLVEKATGSAVADLFVQRGEAAFRALERAAVSTALAGRPGVLALGGGAPMDPDTRKLLAAASVAFLDVGAAAAAARVGMDRSRPLLLGNVRGQLRQLLEVRRPVYFAVATVTVPTEDATPEQVADAVIGALGLTGDVPDSRYGSVGDTDDGDVGA